MNWNDWYTDTVDVYRTEAVKEGALTVNSRTLVMEAVPCRIYQEGKKAPTMTQQAAYVQNQTQLACANDVNICPGDELIIHRGARLGNTAPDIRAFAGDPNHYYEPFGAVIPGLAHQEITLLNMERIK